MALLRTVKPKEAEGFIAETYSSFHEKLGSIPLPIQMMSASPGMFKEHISTIQYFGDHPTLSFPLLTMIRFLVAPDCGWNYCIDFNRMLLKKMGMDDDEIEQTKGNPERAPLEDHERAMLLFVLKAVGTPQEITKEAVDSLHELGWEDSDIYDATFHGARMQAMSTMFNAFKMYDL